MSPASSVVCAGAVTVDTIAVVDELPGADARVRARELAVAGGGPAATAAVALARLGVPVAFCGVVGDDEEGRHAVAELAAEGVDVDRVRVDPAAATARSVVLVDASGARTIVTSGSARLRAEDVPLDAGWLHVDQAGYAAAREALAGARGPRPALSVDGGNEIPGLTLAGVALYAPTVAALRRHTGRDELGAALRAARDEGAERVVATAGGEGGYALTGDEVVHVPAAGGEIVSTLGAGDVFHGALLAALVRGEGLVEAVRLAALVAATSCRALDGRSGIPRLEELDALLAASGEGTR